MNEVLFDRKLELESSLTYLWKRAERLPEEQPGIGAIRFWAPGSLLLRPYYAKDFTGHDIDVDEILWTAETHYDRLQRFGMCIMSYVLEPRTGLRTAKYRKADTIVAYGATKYVDDSANLDALPASDFVPAQKINEFIVDPLLKYVSWCEEAKQTLMLGDIYKKGQYARHESTRTIYLQDIDPVLVSVNGEGIERARQSIDQFIS